MNPTSCIIEKITFFIDNSLMIEMFIIFVKYFNYNKKPCLTTKIT